MIAQKDRGETMTYLSDYYTPEPQGSQAYGAPRPNGRRHTGDDFSHSTRPGTVNVPALRAGVVHSIQVNRPTLNNGYGNQVQVRHEDGSRFSYSHLSTFGEGMRVGQPVEVGQTIGTEGTTGWTNGPCCHVEFRLPGYEFVVDPYPHIRSALAAAAGGGGNPTPPKPPTPDPEEDEMPRNTGIRTQRKSAGDKWVYLLFNYGTGIGHEFGSGSTTPLTGGYVNPIAVAFDTPSWANVTESHYNAIKASLNKVFNLAVDVNDEDIKTLAEAILADDEVDSAVKANEALAADDAVV